MPTGTVRGYLNVADGAGLYVPTIILHRLYYLYSALKEIFPSLFQLITPRVTSPYVNTHGYNFQPVTDVPALNPPAFSVSVIRMSCDVKGPTVTHSRRVGGARHLNPVSGNGKGALPPATLTYYSGTQAGSSRCLFQA